MKDSFVELILDTGDYMCQWEFPSSPSDPTVREPFGSITLGARILPLGHIYGDVPHRRMDGTVSFPQTVEYPVVFGRLQNNMDIVLVDAIVEPFMTDSGFLRGSRAMVGLGIREVPDQLYSRCRVQVTGLDPFFGQPPLRETVTPRNSPFIDGAFSVRGNPASTHVWNDDGIGIRCSYDMQADGLNFYHHELRFFPVVTLNSPEPLSVDGWLDEWVSPLVWLTTLATGQVQEATYVGLKSTSGVTSSQGATEVTAQVFGPWISQAPYASTGRRVDELGRPLESVISLAESSLSLPSLIRQSKAIEATSNPFPELYRLALIPDLPERARFL